MIAKNFQLNSLVSQGAIGKKQQLADNKLKNQKLSRKPTKIATKTTDKAEKPSVIGGNKISNVNRFGDSWKSTE